jgi:hypothetical protein
VYVGLWRLSTLALIEEVKKEKGSEVCFKLFVKFIKFLTIGISVYLLAFLNLPLNLPSMFVMPALKLDFISSLRVIQNMEIE